MSPTEVVKSMPSVWVRVPLAICNGYSLQVGHFTSKVNEDALIAAMLGADVVVYGRNEGTCMNEEPFIFAVNMFKRAKPGSVTEKISDATLALLMGEMLKGGTNISTELAVQAVELGFTLISQEAIERLCNAKFPVSPELVAEVTKDGFMKALAIK